MSTSTRQGARREPARPEGPGRREAGLRSGPSAGTSRARAFRCCGTVCGHVMHTAGFSALDQPSSDS